jgi:hypothetical protein
MRMRCAALTWSVKMAVWPVAPVGSLSAKSWPSNLTGAVEIAFGFRAPLTIPKPSILRGGGIDLSQAVQAVSSVTELPMQAGRPRRGRVEDREAAIAPPTMAPAVA